MRESLEWAVTYPGFRKTVVVKGGLGSREEAEAWCVALQATQNREATAALYERDAIVQPRQLEVLCRRINLWQRADSEGGSR